MISTACTTSIKTNRVSAQKSAETAAISKDSEEAKSQPGKGVLLTLSQQILDKMQKNKDKRAIKIAIENRDAVRLMNKTTFRPLTEHDLTRSGLTVIYAIHACGVLETQSPILEELTQKYQIHDLFRVADLSDPKTAELLQGIFRVKKYTTFLVIEDGKIIDLMTGVRGNFVRKQIIHFLVRNRLVDEAPVYLAHPKNALVVKKGRWKIGDDLRSLNLKNAQFQGGDFSGADLRNTDLRNVDFRQANLSRANLKGANLKGAKFDGAYWFNTICPNGKRTAVKPCL